MVGPKAWQLRSWKLVKEMIQSADNILVLSLREIHVFVSPACNISNLDPFVFASELVVVTVNAGGDWCIYIVLAKREVFT